MRDRIFHVGPPPGSRPPASGIRPSSGSSSTKVTPHQPGNVVSRMLNLPPHVPPKKPKPVNGMGNVGKVGNVLPPLWKIWIKITHD
jgi:hypothetical protein